MILVRKTDVSVFQSLRSAGVTGFFLQSLFEKLQERARRMDNGVDIDVVVHEQSNNTGT